MCNCITDANAETDETKPDIATPHEDWDMMSPPLDRAVLDSTAMPERKKKARMRVGQYAVNTYPVIYVSVNCHLRVGQYTVNTTTVIYDQLMSILEVTKTKAIVNNYC